MNSRVKYVDFKLAFSPEILHMPRTLKMLGLMSGGAARVIHEMTM